MSRSREYGADATGARLVGYPDGLANALRKLQTAQQRIPMRERRSGHRAPVHREPALSGRSLMNLFSTHPPLEDRIARLMATRA